MKKINRFIYFTFVFLIVVSTCLYAVDWPQWRGPNRDGISAETNLLKEWPQDGPTLIWQSSNSGKGYSTPAIEGHRIFLLSNVGMDDEFVKAFDVKTGKEIWSTRIGKVGLPDQKPNFPAARSTPTIDAEAIYALSSDGDIVCLDKKSGKIRWQKNVQTEFGGTPGRWAYAESPLIDGHKVICTPGGSDASMIALNKKTGELIWKTSIPDAIAGYSSAITANIIGVKQYITFMGAGLIGVDAETGELLWMTGLDKDAAPIVTPVLQNDMIYFSSREGCTLVRIENTQNDVRIDTVYSEKKLPNAVGGSVLVGDYLYGTDAKNIMCIEFKTGKKMWQEPRDAAGSLCYADGHLYVHGENGEMILLEATPDAYRELGRFTPPNQPERTEKMAKVWTYPVIADGKLYIRDHDVMWCYAIK